MKRITLLGLAVWALLAVPGLAATTIEFSPGDGGWFYDGSGVLSFQQTYPVSKGLASTTDTLVGAYVHIPDFAVGGFTGGPYTLTPVTGNVITITDSAGTITYLTGTLGVKGGAKVRRVAGRSKSAALPEEFCENAWSFTALGAVEIMWVSAERKGSVLQHGTVVGHSPESTPRGSQQASDSAGDRDALDDAGEDSSAALAAAGVSTA